jgi:two-component system response regulator
MLKQSGDTILLMEDEESEILLAQQAVAKCPGNLHLVVVPDSTEAMAWVSEAPARNFSEPRLILLNLKLPKLLGLAALRTLRLDERTKNIPVVVYSANYDHDDVLMCYQIGANSFVNMPGNLTEFTDMLIELSDLEFCRECTFPSTT